MLKKLCIIFLFPCSFNALSADFSVEREKARIEKIVAQAESATSPNKLFVVGNCELSIMYHLEDYKDLLKFSWYLVGTNEVDLVAVQKYLMNTNPDRNAEEFKLHSLDQNKKALMIFLEMIKQPDLLHRVKAIRDELDSEIENTFWQANDLNKPMVSLLPYSKVSYEDEDTKAVMAIYKPQFTECKPLKYMKVQLFAIAKNMGHPDLQVSFAGLSRTITFKNHKIWPLASGSWLDVQKMLSDEKLTQKQSNYYELTGIDDKTYRVISFSSDANSSDAEEPATKYLKIHKYIRGKSKLLEDVKFCFAYVEAPFWQVAKKFAIRNATEKERAQYQERMALIENVKDDYNDHEAALPLLVESITKNEAAMTLFAAIVYNEEMRNHLISMSKDQHPWANWQNYPFSETDMRNDGDYEVINISPLSLFLSRAFNMVELIKGSMEKELANNLANVVKHFYEIYGSELMADRDQTDKKYGHALTMALMAFSDPKLLAGLNQNGHFMDLLSAVSKDQITSASQLFNSIQELRKLAPKLIQEENLRREKANRLIDAHNADIDAQCASIAKTIDAAFADVLQ